MGVLQVNEDGTLRQLGVSVDNPGEFLITTGLLFEINRIVLHPLGLYLTITLDDNDNTVLFAVRNCREDKEGVLYSKELYAAGQTKIDAYMQAHGLAAWESRTKILGFRVQPKADD